MSDTWNALSRAIREIHNNNASNLSFEENYRYAYNLVLHRQGEILYDGVKTLVAENVDRLVEREVKPAFPTGVTSDAASRSQEMESLLKAVKVVWDEHTGNMSKLRDILKYVVCAYRCAIRFVVRQNHIW
jgi:cullin 3